MHSDPKKLFLCILFMMAAVLLNAQEAFCFFQIKTDLTDQLPAAEARQKAVPPLFAEIGQNLKRNKITLNIPLIAFYGENLLTAKKAEQSFFVMYFHHLKVAQLRYLLNYKLLHPAWKSREENGIFYVETPQLKFVLFQHKDMDGIFASPKHDRLAKTSAEQLLKQIDFNSKNAIFGTFHFPKNTIQHPAMQDVRKANFSIVGGKNTKNEPILKAVFELTGASPAYTQKIANDINLFLSNVYANAEKEVAKTHRRLTDEERKAITCVFKSDKAILSVSFNAEWTMTFLQLFSENLR